MNLRILQKTISSLLLVAVLLTVGAAPALAEPEEAPHAVPESFVLVSEPDTVPDYVYYVRNRQNNNPQSFTWVNGSISGKALKLDGKTEYIRLSSNKVKELSEFTFSAWIRWSGLTEDSGKEQRLLSVCKNKNHCLLVSPHNVDTGRDLNGIEVSLEDRQIDPLSLHHEAGGPVQSAFPVDEWHHVALVFSDDTLALYIDGVAYVEADPDLSVEAMDLQRFVIGSEFEGDAQFNGYIDEAVVYTEALDQNQILLLTQKKEPQKGLTPTTNAEVLATRPSAEPTAPIVEQSPKILGLPPVVIVVLGSAVILVIVLSFLLSMQNKTREKWTEEDHP